MYYGGMDEKQPKKFYTVQEAAELLGVHRNTIMRWIQGELISSYRVSPAPQAPHRIPAEEIERYQAVKETAPT